MTNTERCRRTFPVLALAGFLPLAGPLAGSAAAASVPDAVSPGHDSALAPIASTCPTFSWSGSGDVSSYEIVVYEVGRDQATSRAVVRERVPGGATSWTPSLDSCLERGSSYAWSVRSIRGTSASSWSTPSLFRLVAEPVASSSLGAPSSARGNPVNEAFDLGNASPAEPPLEPSKQAGRSSLAPDVAAAAPTQMMVDGGVVATSFTGDGSTLTDLDPANLSAGTADISITGTATPTGAAGGDLGGSYPNPTVGGDIARDTEVVDAIAAHADLPNAHHEPPTSLPDDDAWEGTGDVYTTSGRVGVGIQIPGAQLHVARDAGALTPMLHVTGNAGITGLYVDSWNRVGVRTTDMDREFNLDGTMVIDSSDSSNGILWQTSSTALINGIIVSSSDLLMGIGRNQPLKIEDLSPPSSIHIKADGKVGIGTSDPASTMEVDGELTVAGYTRLAVIAAAPPAVDCDGPEERGRMKLDTVNGLLYVCADSGWLSK